jgi:hypothetical protein
MFRNLRMERVGYAAPAEGLSPAKYDVPHAMSESEAAALELGQRTVRGPQGKAAGGIFKQGFGLARGQDRRGIFFLVGRRVQVAAWRQAQRQRAHERRL